MLECKYGLAHPLENVLCSVIVFFWPFRSLCILSLGLLPGALRCGALKGFKHVVLFCILNGMRTMSIMTGRT